MNRARPIQHAVVGFMVALLVTASSGATTARAGSIVQSADIEVTGTMHEAPHYDSPWDQWVEAQPPLMLGEGARFYNAFTNHGPDKATVTYEITRWGMDHGRRAGYNSLSVPFRNLSTGYPTLNRDCGYERSFHKVVMTCVFSMVAGSTTWFEWWGDVQAAGRVATTARAWSNLSDPDESNNSLTLLDTRVTCSIEGTPGDDILEGTSEPESICGRGGNDTITNIGPGDDAFGEGGDDLLVPGPYEPGESTALGGAGRDRVSYREWDKGVFIHWGGIGPNQGGTLLTVEEADRSLNEIAQYLSDMEVLIGTSFGDRIKAGSGREVIRGTGGNDEIKGDGGRDVLIGGRGHDLFHSRDGVRDRVLGGSGRDKAYADKIDRTRSVKRVSRIPFEQ